MKRELGESKESARLKEIWLNLEGLPDADEWKKVNLGAVININPPRQLKRGSKSVYIPMDRLQPNTRKVSGFSWRNFKGSGSRFRNYDTLLARITPCLENGKTAFVDFLPDEEIAYGSTEFIVLSSKEGITSSLYVYYLARLPHFREFAISLMEGTSGRQRVPATTLKNYEFYLPPLPEQKAIARILGTLDDKIELNQQMNRTLEATARAIFKSWFVDFDPVRALIDGRQPEGMDAETAALFPDEFEDSELGMIPKGWRVAPLSKSCESIFSGGTPRTKNLEYWGGDIPWLSSGETRNQFITTSEKTITALGVANSSTRLAKARSILIASAGQGHTRGQTSLLMIDSYINQSTIALIADSINISDLYLFFDLSRRYEELRQISDSHSSRGSLTTKLLAELKILIPPPKLISIFNRQVEPLVKKICQNLAENRTFATLRDTLLPKLMSGEIRVVEAEKMVEDVA